MSFGQRWTAETVFSSIKRTFGEYVTARNFQNMAKELILKASLYNMVATIM
ncbi:MAG: transposase [Nitrososphaeraceae archaeon]